MARTTPTVPVPVAPPPAVPPAPASRPRSFPLIVGLVALVALAAALRLGGTESVPWLNNLLLVFSSLLVQAFPFVLLGALISAAIEVFVPDRVFARLGALPRGVQLPASGLSGMAFPVCECGSVPVARRLAAKGLTPGAAVTFMLAAPVVNPIVLVSTAAAYRARDHMWLMVLGRFGLGLAAAVAVGWVVGVRSREDLLRPRPQEEQHEVHGNRSAAFFAHFASDTIFMGSFLVAGAMAAALVQTFVPPATLSALAETAVIDVLALMGLAALLSLCSQSDAFVAASFVQFSPSAQLGFLVFGPMFNLKLAPLYAGTYRRGFVPVVAAVVGAVTLAGVLWVGVLAP